MNPNLLSRYQEETNKRLLYARLTLELTEQFEEPYITALKESSLGYLIQSYNALVDEIQVRLNKTPQLQPNLLAIVPILKKGDRYAAEINLLVKLEEDSASWLNLMRRMQNTPSQAINRIEPIPPLEVRNLTDWLEKLEQLIRHLRSAMTEY